jgi:hypothetical protein
MKVAKEVMKTRRFLILRMRIKFEKGVWDYVVWHRWTMPRDSTIYNSNPRLRFPSSFLPLIQYTYLTYTHSKPLNSSDFQQIQVVQLAQYSTRIRYYGVATAGTA